MKRLFLILVLPLLLFLASCNDLITGQGDRELSIIPFSNDNQRFGLVDLKGNIIVENEWETPSSIATEGIVRVKNKEGYYEFYTAERNPKKIGAAYKDATLFSEGLAAVVNEKGFIHYIDKEGIIKFELPDDGKGSPVLKAGVFSEGLARFQNAENLWGFINKDGQVVIKPMYDYARNFSEGLAMVERYNNTTHETSRGFINKHDEEVIPVSDRYTAFLDFKQGLAGCTDRDLQNQWGYINEKGDKVIEINKVRVQVMPFQQDGHAAFFDGAYWGLINRKGEIVVNPTFDRLLSFYHNGLGPFKNSRNEIGFVNADRKEVIKCKYEEVLPFYANTTVVKDKYYIFIDKKGEQASDKNTYLRYVPINKIIKQYESFNEQLVKTLFLNASAIANTIFKELSGKTVNNLSFNSNVNDVINYFKIPRSRLPRNSYQKYIEEKIDLTGNTQPYKVKINFTEPIQMRSKYSNSMVINDKAMVKSVEVKIYTQGMNREQLASLIDNIKLKIENAGYTLDEEAARKSWKDNVEFYRDGQTLIEFEQAYGEINVTVDFSNYF
jgi:hypothetical protein